MDDKFILMNKSKKEIITKILLQELPDNYFGTSEIEKIIFSIWCTGRTGSGLRLTEQGYNAFTDANLAFYEYTFDVKKIVKDKKNFTRLSITLDKKIKCPFYAGIKIENKQPYIRIYDSKIAMMINLYGSIEEYIKLSL